YPVCCVNLVKAMKNHRAVNLSRALHKHLNSSSNHRFYSSVGDRVAVRYRHGCTKAPINGPRCALVYRESRDFGRCVRPLRGGESENCSKDDEGDRCRVNSLCKSGFGDLDEIASCSFDAL